MTTKVVEGMPCNPSVPTLTRSSEKARPCTGLQECSCDNQSSRPHHWHR